MSARTLIFGASFALHFTVLKRRDLGSYWRDTEFKAYFLLTAVVTGFATLYLYVMHEFPTLIESLRHAAFQVVSMQTTTGLLTEGFAHWPGSAFDAAVDELVARGLFEEHGSGRLIVWPWSGVTG